MEKKVLGPALALLFLLLSGCKTEAAPPSPSPSPSPKLSTLYELLSDGAAGYDARLTTLEGVLALYGEGAGAEDLEEVFAVYPFDDCVLVRSGPGDWRGAEDVGCWTLYCLPLGRGVGLGDFYGDFCRRVGENEILVYQAGLGPGDSYACIPSYRHLACDPQDSGENWFREETLPFYEDGLSGEGWPEMLEGKVRKIGTGAGLEPMEVTEFAESEDALTLSLRILSGNPPPGGGSAPLVWTQLRLEWTDGRYQEVLTVRIENVSWPGLTTQPQALPLSGTNKFCEEAAAHQADGEVTLRIYLPEKTLCSVRPSVIDMTEGTVKLVFAEELPLSPVP